MDDSHQDAPPNAMRRLAILGGITATASLSGWALKPSTLANKEVPAPFDLEAMVPRKFGDWQEQAQPVQAVNPQTQALLDKLYSQILGRTYLNKNGYLIMLSLSYGADQRGALEAHKPEVCYPAQGFTVTDNKSDVLRSKFGTIEVRRLNTQLGQRQEPLTYWFTIGNSTVQSRIEKRLVEIKLALTGQIPDGMLFRVSSIDPDPKAAWLMQDQFVNDLLTTLDAPARLRLTGL